MSLLITNIAQGWVGDADGTRLTGAIRIEGDRIDAIGDLTPRADEAVLDANGCVVAPGLVNTHHHLFQSAMKGLALDCALDDWLKYVPYTHWSRLREEDLRVSARIGLTELALTGATTVCDHHYIFTDYYDYDPAEVLFQEAERLGMRFVLARGGMTKGRDYFGPDAPPSPVETLKGFLDGLRSAASRWQDPSDTAMTRVACAPTTPNFNFEPEALPEMLQEARHLGLRLHTHLCENENYANHTMRVHGKRPLDWLAGLDWLGPDVWFAHLVDITPDEVALLAQTGTAMAHCPQANARLGSGIAPAPALHRAGGTVSLAVDGAGANEAADMGAALYHAFTLHRAAHGVDATDAATVLHWATMGGAKALGLPGIGALRPGMAADIALFDVTAPRNFGLHDPALAPMVTGAAPVRHSLVGGRVIVRDGCMVALDLDELRADAARVTAHMARSPQAPPS